MPRFSRSLVFVCTSGFALVLLLKLASPGEFEPTPEYEAACVGPPLRTMEKRYKAQEDGHFVNRQFDCIDKAFYVAEAKWRAESAAANTPEALAKQRAEFAAAAARQAEERQRREAEAAAHEEANRPELVLRLVDVNTATETDIARVFPVGPDGSRQIVEERSKRRFSGWDDLVSRVVALSAAQSAFYASTAGLTVDGAGMDGAPMNADLAAAIYERQHGRRPVVRLAP